MKKLFAAVALMVVIMMLPACAHDSSSSAQGHGSPGKLNYGLSSNEPVHFGVYERGGARNVLSVTRRQGMAGKSVTVPGHLLVFQGDRLAKKIPVNMTVSCDGSPTLKIQGATASGKTFAAQGTIARDGSMVVDKWEVGFNPLAE